MKTTNLGTGETVSVLEGLRLTIGIEVICLINIIATKVLPVPYQGIEK